ARLRAFARVAGTGALRGDPVVPRLTRESCPARWSDFLRRNVVCARQRKCRFGTSGGPENAARSSGGCSAKTPLLHAPRNSRRWEWHISDVCAFSGVPSNSALSLQRAGQASVANTSRDCSRPVPPQYADAQFGVSPGTATPRRLIQPKFLRAIPTRWHGWRASADPAAQRSVSFRKGQHSAPAAPHAVSWITGSRRSPETLQNTVVHSVDGGPCSATEDSPPWPRHPLPRVRCGRGRGTGTRYTAAHPARHRCTDSHLVGTPRARPPRGSTASISDRGSVLAAARTEWECV